MPPVVLTQEQRAWANQVLAILGKTPAEGGAPGTPPSAPSGVESEKFARYAEGLKQPFNLEARGKLADALKDPSAKKMISAEDWLGLADSVETKKEREKALDLAGRHKALAEKRIKCSQVVSPLLKTKAQYAEAEYRLLAFLGAKPKGEYCDLTDVPPYNKKVPANEVNKIRAEAINYQDEIEKKLTGPLKELKEADDLLHESMAVCLPLLDAPENNPERAEVGKLLESLEGVEKRIGEQPLTKELAKEKFKALADLEKQLFAWNDRRAGQNLPPSAEAVALLDLHQTVHQQLIKEAIENPEWDPPIAGYDGLLEEEKTRLKNTWKDLLAGEGGVRISKEDAKDNGEAAQFRVETLANFARLLATQAGRYLIDELNASGQQVQVKVATNGEMTASPPPPGSGRIDELGRAGRRVGTTVSMPSGTQARASKDMANAKSGNYLYDPTFIGLGHELIHALHSARGKCRDKLRSPNNAEWTNREEYRTIFEGKTTENTLRHQCGLVTERYGHTAINAKEEVTRAFTNEVLASEQLKISGKRITRNLTNLGFDPKNLTDVKKLEYGGSKVDGKALVGFGWDPNQLTVKQAEAVVKNEIRFNDLKVLGWAPHELPEAAGNDSIKDVVRTKNYHPRSPEGHRFRTMGGNDALNAIVEFNKATKVSLKEGAKDNGVDQLKALDDADTWLRQNVENDPTFPEWASKSNGGKKGSQKKLTVRLPRAAEFYNSKK